MKTSIHTYPTAAQSIGAMASWPATLHQFEPEHILALQATQATGRPLLIRGEAGTGKSQLAHAAAAVTGRAFLPVVVAAATEAADLHWKFDAIARLADAHAVGNSAAAATDLHIKHYVQPGALWWALNWGTAQAQQAGCWHGGALVPASPADWTPQKGVVLLIDEIDKAEPDLPNGLLEAMANGAFDVPLLGITVKQDESCPKPIIIITTNDERELPAAFLRRCLVLTLQLPTEDAALRDYLVQRGTLHFPALAMGDTLKDCADMLVQDRKEARRQHCYTPGLGEYLDLLRAVQELGSSGIEGLKKLKHFYFEKQPSPQNGASP